MSHAPGTVFNALVKLGKTPGDCWQWIGGIDALGYGRKRFAGKDWLAHRWVWSQLFGPVPDGLVVTHSCDKRDCVNPHHLRAVTQAENCREGVTAILTSADVTEIRAARKNPTPNMSAHLAQRYGVAPSTIKSIWGRKSWRKPKTWPTIAAIRESIPPRTFKTSVVVDRIPVDPEMAKRNRERVAEMLAELDRKLSA